MTGEALREETNSKRSRWELSHRKQEASTVKDTPFSSVIPVSDACSGRLLMLRESLLNVFTCSLKIFRC